MTQKKERDRLALQADQNGNNMNKARGRFNELLQEREAEHSDPRVRQEHGDPRVSTKADMSQVRRAVEHKGEKRGRNEPERKWW